MGAVTSYSVGSGRSFGQYRFTISDIQNLQNHAELFISRSLGVPGLVQGPGNHVQETLRRVVISAAAFVLNVDQATSYYDDICIAPGTISILTIYLAGIDWRKVDLQKQILSFVQ